MHAVVNCGKKRLRMPCPEQRLRHSHIGQAAIFGLFLADLDAGLPVKWLPRRTFIGAPNRMAIRRPAPRQEVVARFMLKPEEKARKALERRRSTTKVVRTMALAVVRRLCENTSNRLQALLQTSVVSEAGPLKKLDRLAVSVVLVGTFFSVGAYSQGSAPPPLPQGNTGIAAAYPHDTGISTNPNVLFADGFESYTSPTQLTGSGNYSNYYAQQNFAIDTSTFFAGAKALRMRMPASGAEISNGLVRNISPTRDSMFMRVYTRFQPNYAGINSAHNGLRITGKYKGPGIRPDGQGISNGFLVNIENSTQQSEGEPGNTHAYVYQPENTDVYGENWYPDGTVTNGTFSFGQYFVARPRVIPTRGTWLCYETLVQMNTPGLRDGRVAVWQDGVLIADWQNVRFRDVTTLKIDQIELDNGGQGSTQQNDKWYDNLVIATSYIGPMVASSNPPTAPTNLRISGQ